MGGRRRNQGGRKEGLDGREEMSGMVKTMKKHLQITAENSNILATLGALFMLQAAFGYAKISRRITSPTPT